MMIIKSYIIRRKPAYTTACLADKQYKYSSVFMHSPAYNAARRLREESQRDKSIRDQRISNINANNIPNMPEDSNMPNNIPNNNIPSVGPGPASTNTADAGGGGSDLAFKILVILSIVAVVSLGVYYVYKYYSSEKASIQEKAVEPPVNSTHELPVDSPVELPLDSTVELPIVELATIEPYEILFLNEKVVILVIIVSIFLYWYYKFRKRSALLSNAEQRLLK
jgi:hypothetical protein